MLFWVMHTCGWDQIQKHCGEMNLDLTRRDKASGTWGGLVPAGNSTVKEWVDIIKEGGGGGRYAFDQPLPAKCPQLLNHRDFLIPKYFVADYMYRMPRGAAFFTNMPSLFLGSLSTLIRIRNNHRDTTHRMLSKEILITQI